MLTLEYATQFKKDFKKIAKLPMPDVVEVGHEIKHLQLGIRNIECVLIF